METMVMVGFALAFIIPLTLLFFASTGSEMGKYSVAQAKASVRQIAVEAGDIYLQGAGARKTILVNYPEGIMDGSVQDKLVVLRIDADGRVMDIASPTFANITGNLSGKKFPGVHRISMLNVNGSYVNITYG
jgi:hypothetical protein